LLENAGVTVTTECLVQNEHVTETDVKSASSSSGRRVGCLHLLSLSQLASSEPTGQDSLTSTELNILHSVDVPGVLDVKWCDGVYGKDESGLPLFATADANGDLLLWSVNRSEATGEADCHLVEIMSAEEGGAMALSVDWSTAVCCRFVSSKIISMALN